MYRAGFVFIMKNIILDKKCNCPAIPYRLLKSAKNTVGILLHLAESYNFLPEILDRASYEINGIVNYQKAVMDIRAVPDLNSWILGIVVA